MIITLNNPIIENFGTGSLIGLVMKQNNNQLPDRLELQFEQSTTEHKQQHGPDAWITTEHVIPCLIDDILNLQKMGVNISVSIHRG